jgi:hypothetical protein
MLTLCIWWAGIILEIVLLFRGFQGRLLSRFPVFYSYILAVLLESIVTFGFFRWAPKHYAIAYWICLFLALLMGSLVVFEIYRITLRPYAGTSRMARNALLFVFALAVAKVLVYKSNGSLPWLAHAPAELERNLRVVQALGIFVILCILLLYAIPCSRNLKGILLGYALFVCSSVFQLSLLSHFGSAFKHIWVVLQPFSYLCFLVVWLYFLWSPAPEPVHEPETSPEDYSRIASDTQQELAKLRLGFRKAER